MLDLAPGTDLVQLQQVPVGIIEEQDVPFALAREVDWWRDKLYPFRLQAIVGLWHVLHAEANVGAGDVMNRLSPKRTFGRDPLDQIEGKLADSR